MVIPLQPLGVDLQRFGWLILKTYQCTWAWLKVFLTLQVVNTTQLWMIDYIYKYTNLIRCHKEILAWLWYTEILRELWFGVPSHMIILNQSALFQHLFITLALGIIAKTSISSQETSLTYPMQLNFAVNKRDIGLCLWLSWQSGRFRH